LIAESWRRQPSASPRQDRGQRSQQASVSLEANCSRSLGAEIWPSASRLAKRRLKIGVLFGTRQ
jgi:hypothetical protein